MLFLPYMQMNTDNCYFFLSLFFFLKTEIIITLSISDKAKVNAKHHVELSYSDWLQNASVFYHLVSFPSRTVHLLTRHSCLKTGLPLTGSEFIRKDEWPRNSPDVNPLDYHIWGVTRENYKTFHPKPKNTDGLKKVLQVNMKSATAGFYQPGHT